MSMHRFESEQNKRLQVIDGGRLARPVSAATAINKGIRDALIRLITRKTELDIGSLKKAASYAGIRGANQERKALAVIADYITDLEMDRRAMDPPTGPFPGAAGAVRSSRFGGGLFDVAFSRKKAA